MPDARSEGARLVYVEGPWAYFATDPDSARGDDWNDAPHDCNAGTPYSDHGGVITRVAYDGDLEVVGGALSGTGVGRWGYLSVEDINGGAAPWLVQVRYGARDDGSDLIPLGVQIPAGVTLADFHALVAKAGGRVYVAAASQKPAPGA